MSVPYPSACIQDLVDFPNVNGSLVDWAAGTSFTTAVGLAINWNCTTLGTGGSPAATMSQQAFTLGATAPLPGSPEYFLRIAMTALASTTGINIQHRIEDVRTFAGAKVTAEFWYRSDQAITVKMVQNYGTGGSPTTAVTIDPSLAQPGTTVSQPVLPISASVNDGANGPTTQAGWTLYRIPFELPGIPTGGTLGTTANTSYLALQFTGPINVAAFTLDLAHVRVYQGWEAAPTGRRRPRQQELSLTKRYYGSYTAYAPVSTQSSNWVPFPVTMRGVPTMAGGTGSTLGTATVDGFPIVSTGAAAAITAITADARL